MFAVDPDGDNQVKGDGAVVLPTRAGHASINVTLQSPAGAADLHPCKGSTAQQRAGSARLRVGVRLDAPSNGNALPYCVCHLHWKH